ncbi:MAG: hypothetical protein ABIH52_04815, partial [Candidatus Aenigmatarchaeota archaeon]
MVSVREGYLARMYNGVWEFIQFQFWLPGGMTISLTYNPPNDTAFVPIYHVTEAYAAGALTLSIHTDGDLEYQNLLTTPKFGDYLFEKQITYVVKNDIRFDITNNTAAAILVDGLIFGYLIPLSNIDGFLEEITGRKQLNEIIETKKLLVEINKKLNEGKNILI